MADDHAITLLFFTDVHEMLGQPLTGAGRIQALVHERSTHAGGSEETEGPGRSRTPKAGGSEETEGPGTRRCRSPKDSKDLAAKELELKEREMKMREDAAAAGTSMPVVAPSGNTTSTKARLPKLEITAFQR